MSTFGAPGNVKINTKPTPPERGSFPLDHDGECKHVMTKYMTCLKAKKGMNDPECRMLAKDYLSCRMDHNLMAKDEFKNLGFAEPEQQTAKPSEDKGTKGELQW